MKKHNISELEISRSGDGYAKNSVMVFGDEENIYDGPIIEKCAKLIDAIVLKLGANEEIDEHRHDLSEEIILILDGGGEFIQPDQREAVRKDDLVFLERGVPHILKAGNDGLTMLVFHGPPMHDRK